MSEAWYRIALAGVQASGPIVVVAPGEHLGAAIDVAVRRVGKAAWPAAAAPAAGPDVPLGESVGKGVVVERGPAPSTALASFRWPTGLLPSLDHAAAATAAAVEGWVRRPVETIAVIEAQVTGDRTVETFLELVERLPAADNIEVKVFGHYDDAGATEVWLSPRLDVRRAIRFLDDHDVELIDNGHVELSLYLRQERSTLRLTEHKTIVWMSEEQATVERFTGWLAALKVPAAPELVTLGDLDHYHYRPARSSPRGRLIERLKRMRLRKVDAYDAV